MKNVFFRKQKLVEPASHVPFWCTEEKNKILDFKTDNTREYLDDAL